MPIQIKMEFKEESSSPREIKNLRPDQAQNLEKELKEQKSQEKDKEARRKRFEIISKRRLIHRENMKIEDKEEKPKKLQTNEEMSKEMNRHTRMDRY